MTLVLAIPCKEGIIIAADSKAIDFDTGDARLPICKIHELTVNSALVITGSGLIDKLDEYIDGLVQSVRDKGHTSIDNIAEAVKQIVDRRGWAEYKDEYEKSHMGIIVVGYSNEPKVYAILDNRQIKHVAYCVLGNWDGAVGYLVDNASKDYKENIIKKANSVAVKMLSKATEADPKEIGRPFHIWHILPDGIRKLKEADIESLDKRHNGANE